MEIRKYKGEVEAFSGMLIFTVSHNPSPTFMLLEGTDTWTYHKPVKACEKKKIMYMANNKEFYVYARKMLFTPLK